MFILICMIACAIIFGILGHKDGDTELGVLEGLLIGAGGGLLVTFITSVILFFAVPPVTTVETYKLEQHMDTSSYVYYVNVDKSKYSFAYFDESEIINVDNVKNVSFDFDEKSRKVKIQKKKMGGALDIFFLNLHQTKYDITIPSKEYIRYE